MSSNPANLTPEFNMNKRHLGFSLFILAVIVVFAYFTYQWFFCRFYVPAGYMAIVTAKSGNTPKPGQILVSPGEKGIWAEPLAEGRHFLDPFMHDITILPAVTIPLGKVGIVTAKIGNELNPGEVIAPDRNSKGVWRNVLGPGIYRLNPQGYQVDIADAVSIPIGYVGVITSQNGKEYVSGEFAKMGQKGVLRDILQPGLYYLNPYAYQVNIIEIGMNQVTMSGQQEGRSIIAAKNRQDTAGTALDEMQENTLNVQKQQLMELAKTSSMGYSSSRAMPAKSIAEVGEKKEREKFKSKKPGPAEKADKAARIGASADSAIYGVSHFVEFPSRDGFKIMIDMTVEFELMPEFISRIYLLYGDLPQVVEKIILPQVLSVSRLKGSSYRAQDFIMGEGRETFQNELRNELVKTLAEKNIIVHNAIIRNVEIPMDILNPIREVSLAKEQKLTNVSLQDASKIQAELNTQVALIDQKVREVEQSTRKLVAEVAANQNQSVEKIRATTALEVAKLQLQKSEIVAKIAKIKGETEASVVYMLENQRSLGSIQKAKAIGSREFLSELKLVENLNPKIETQIIYAGEGTLWTDLRNSSIAIPRPVTNAK
jgi:hypothetical protein